MVRSPYCPGDVVCLNRHQEPPDEAFDFLVLADPVNTRMERLLTTVRYKRAMFISSGCVHRWKYPREAITEKQDGEDIANRYGAIIARGFSFVGPDLPADRYAVGQFIMGGINNRMVVVKGDGEPLRSYLHQSDMAEWFWTILQHGDPKWIYNVGSTRLVQIKELALFIALELHCGISINNEYDPFAEDYFPTDLTATADLGLIQKVAYGDAIRDTINAWRKI